MSDLKNIDFVNNLLENNPNSSASFIAAKIYLEKGDYEKAILLCKDSLNIFPCYLTGYLLLINSYIMKADYISAKNILKKANKIFPNHWVFNSSKKILLEQGIDIEDLFYDKQEEIESEPEFPLQIDDHEIESFVEESKPDINIETSDIDDYIKEAVTNNIALEDNSNSSPIQFPDELLTLTDFEPTSQTTNKELSDEIVSNLIQEETHQTPVKVTNDKYNIEKELSQLLKEEDLNNLETSNFSTLIDTFEENPDKFTPPTLVSKTMANVYESQGRFHEAIEIYKTLYKNKEISLEECESKINDLQNKILTSTDLDI